MQESTTQNANPQAGDLPRIETVTIRFAVTGEGSFKADAFDTSKGDVEGQVEEGKRIRLRAEAAPFFWFSHWELNDMWADDDPKTKIMPKEGMVIRAVFRAPEQESYVQESSSQEDPAPDGQEDSLTREIIDGWRLRGPGDSDSSRAPKSSEQVKISNSSRSHFDVYFYRNGSQLGYIAPRRSITLRCNPGDRFEVRSMNAKKGEEASGAFVYYP